MNRILIIIMAFFLSMGTAAAQQGPSGRERIQAIRTSFITERINLTSAQAERFWPVYNRYTGELRSIRQSFRQKYRGQTKDEAQARQFIEDNLDYQEEELALKRKYKNQLLQIISAQQLAQLYQAERDFKKMLLNQLGRNRGRR